MPNWLTELVIEADQRKWCVRPYCTTCGCMDFRKAVRSKSGPSGGHLVDALSELAPAEIASLPNWENAVQVAFIDCPFPQLVIEAWGRCMGEDIAFADYVTFYFVRRLALNSEARVAWISKSVALALNTQNFSLTESLVLTLGRQTVKEPQLLDLALEHAKSSPQMRRVLRNVGLEAYTKA